MIGSDIVADTLEPDKVVPVAAAGLQAPPLSMKTKLAFAIGTTGEAIAIFSVTSFAMLYYNQVLGLPAYLVGLAMSVGLILDGPCDLLMGVISDRTVSKFGRRHLYMYLAPFPIAIALFAVFNPPEMSHTGLFIWCLVWIVVLRQVMNVFHTPHFALGGELSRDYTERTKVMAYASFSQAIGAVAQSWVALSFFFRATPDYPKGLLNPQPWMSYSLTAAVTVVLMLYASAWYTRDRIPFLPRPHANLPKLNFKEFYRDVSKAFSNFNYSILILAYFLLTMMTGVRYGLAIYTNTFFWELPSESVRWVTFGVLLGYGAAFFVTTHLHQMFDKKPVIIAAAIVQAVVPSVPIILGLNGIITPDTPHLVPYLMVSLLVSSIGGGVLTISVTSAVADIADENDLRFGLRQEGVMYAMRTMFGKIDQAIGAALAGLILTVIGFPAKAQVGEVAVHVVRSLAISDGLLAAVPGFLAIFPYMFYRIDRRSYEATKAALAKRDEAARLQQAEAPQ